MSYDPYDSDNVVPSTPEPSGNIPSDLIAKNADLDNQIAVLDMKDEIKHKEDEIYHRTHMPTPKPAWKHFTRLQQFILNFKNADTIEKTKIASITMFVLSIIATLIVFFSGHVGAEDALILNVVLACLSQIGNLIANNFSVTNSIPYSAYTYTIPAIQPKVENTYQTTDSTSSSDDEGA